MGILKSMRGGADLTKPTASLNWIMMAFFGILILIVVGVLAMFTFNKAKTVVPGLPAVTEGARTYMS